MQALRFYIGRPPSCLAYVPRRPPRDTHLSARGFDWKPRTLGGISIAGEADAELDLLLLQGVLPLPPGQIAATPTGGSSGRGRATQAPSSASYSPVPGGSRRRGSAGGSGAGARAAAGRGGPGARRAVPALDLSRLEGEGGRRDDPLSMPPPAGGGSGDADAFGVPSEWWPSTDGPHDDTEAWPELATEEAAAPASLQAGGGRPRAAAARTAVSRPTTAVARPPPMAARPMTAAAARSPSGERYAGAVASPEAARADRGALSGPRYDENGDDGSEAGDSLLHADGVDAPIPEGGGAASPSAASLAAIRDAASRVRRAASATSAAMRTGSDASTSYLPAGGGSPRGSAGSFAAAAGAPTGTPGRRAQSAAPAPAAQAGQRGRVPAPPASRPPSDTRARAASARTSASVSASVDLAARQLAWGRLSEGERADAARYYARLSGLYTERLGMVRGWTRHAQAALAMPPPSDLTASFVAGLRGAVRGAAARPLADPGGEGPALAPRWSAFSPRPPPPQSARGAAEAGWRVLGATAAPLPSSAVWRGTATFFESATQTASQRPASGPHVGLTPRPPTAIRASSARAPATSGRPLSARTPRSALFDAHSLASIASAGYIHALTATDDVHVHVDFPSEYVTARSGSPPADSSPGPGGAWAARLASSASRASSARAASATSGRPRGGGGRGASPRPSTAAPCGARPDAVSAPPPAPRYLRMDVARLMAIEHMYTSQQL